MTERTHGGRRDNRKRRPNDRRGGKRAGGGRPRTRYTLPAELSKIVIERAAQKMQTPDEWVTSVVWLYLLTHSAP